MVVHRRAPLQEDHRVVAHHRIVPVQVDLALAAHRHLQDLLLHVHNLERNAQLAEVAQTALGQHVKFPKVVKSAIHAGFVPLHKNATNQEFAHVSLNRIFLKMSLARNSKRVFAQSC
jgi:hypothetical protein